MKWIIASALILSCGWISTAHAEQDLTKLSLEELLNVPMASASKTVKPLLELPVTAAVVTREQIEDRGYRDLLDVLRDLPGIHVVDFSNSEHAASEVFVRGLDANSKMLFLMDGEEIAPPTGEPFTFLRNIPLVAVHQVELSYGSAAALYGADAIAGIVNVVTFAGQEAEPTEVWASAGSHDSFEAQARHRMELAEDVSLSLSGSVYTSAQEDLPRAYPDVFGGHAVDALLESHNINAKLRAKEFTLSYLRLSGNRNNAMGFLPSLYDYSGNSTWNTRNEFWLLQWGHAWAPSLTSRSTVSYAMNKLVPESSYSTDFAGAGEFVPHFFHWRGESTRLAQDLHWQHDRLSWLAGAEVVWYQSTPKTDIDNPLGAYDVEFRGIGTFTQLEFDATEALEFTAGVRFDDDSRFTGEWNPRLGMVWRPSSAVRSHLSWGSAYLAPAPHKVYERWGTIAEGEYIHLPNENLLPEQTSTFDAGVDWFPGERTYLALSGFHTVGRDLWRVAFQGPIQIDGFNLLYQVNDNVAKSTILGFHLMGRYDLGRGVSLGGHYTYTGGTQDGIDLESTVDLNQMARHLLQLSADWQDSVTHARLVGRWYDRITSSELNAQYAGGTVNGSWVFDLYADRELFSGVPSLRLGLDVRNVLDTSYDKVSQFDGFFFTLPTIPQQRRMVSLTARTSF